MCLHAPPPTTQFAFNLEHFLAQALRREDNKLRTESFGGEIYPLFYELALEKLICENEFLVDFREFPTHTKSLFIVVATGFGRDQSSGSVCRGEKLRRFYGFGFNMFHFSFRSLHNGQPQTNLSRAICTHDLVLCVCERNILAIVLDSFIQ